MQNRVLIVGAGVIGSGIAYELVKRGVPVVLLESRGQGGATSAASAGMVNPLGLSTPNEALIPIGLISQRMYDQWAHRLMEEVGIDIEWTRCGSLKIALNESEAAECKASAKWMATYDPEVRFLSGDEARRTEPLISPACQGALWLPNEGQVSGQRLVGALQAAALQYGAEIQRGQPVIGFETQGNRVIGIRTSSGLVCGEAVVVAAGAWTGALLHHLGLDISIQPVRGQIIILTDAPKPLRHVVYSLINYVVPKRDGTIWLGATVEHARFDLRPTAEGFAHLLNTLPATLPTLLQATFSGYTVGLRPGSPDGEPLIGHLPGWENLLIASGHYRHGILLAPVTAQAIADLMTTGKTDLPIAPFSPARFLTEGVSCQ